MRNQITPCLTLQDGTKHYCERPTSCPKCRTAEETEIYNAEKLDNEMEDYKNEERQEHLAEYREQYNEDY